MQGQNINLNRDLENLVGCWIDLKVQVAYCKSFIEQHYIYTLVLLISCSMWL